MERIAEQSLLKWKESTNRKPLLVYGARQVGKTWLMKQFGSKNFENTVYINFEKEIALRGIFQQDYQPQRILKAIEAYTGQSILEGKTLLILDEIQEAKGALTALKYFREDMQALHVIGAGSLLGIALKQQTSFPVGQVEFLHLYPMNFKEFLLATGNKALAELIEAKDWTLLSTLKSKVIDLLKHYFYVGGMPEALLAYSSGQNYNQVRAIQQNILLSYEQDFSKHAPTEVIPRIRMVWNSIVSQLAKENKKFIFGVIRKGARSKEFETALNWLEDYGLISRIHCINKAHFPLAAYSDLNVFKVYIHDIGLLGALGNLHAGVLVDEETLFTEFKGALTEQYVFQELKANGINKLFYWANDSGSAEVDFLFEHERRIYPLEVKAGENLQAKSLKTFANKNPEIHCFRTSLSDYREESWMSNVPLWAVSGMIES